MKYISNPLSFSLPLSLSHSLSVLLSLAVPAAALLTLKSPQPSISLMLSPLWPCRSLLSDGTSDKREEQGEGGSLRERGTTL